MPLAVQSSQLIASKMRVVPLAQPLWACQAILSMSVYEEAAGSRDENGAGGQPAAKAVKPGRAPPHRGAQLQRYQPQRQAGAEEVAGTVSPSLAKLRSNGLPGWRGAINS
jgi:hypothetical protein